MTNERTEHPLFACETSLLRRRPLLRHSHSHLLRLPLLPSCCTIHFARTEKQQTAPRSLTSSFVVFFSSLCPAFPFIALQYFPSPFYPSDPVAMFPHTPPSLPLSLFPSHSRSLLSPLPSVVSAPRPLATSPFSPFPPAPRCLFVALRSRETKCILTK